MREGYSWFQLRTHSRPGWIFQIHRLGIQDKRVQATIKVSMELSGQPAANDAFGSWHARRGVASVEGSVKPIEGQGLWNVPIRRDVLGGSPVHPPRSVATRQEANYFWPEVPFRGLSKVFSAQQTIPPSSSSRHHSLLSEGSDDDIAPPSNQYSERRFYPPFESHGCSYRPVSSIRSWKRLPRTGMDDRKQKYGSATCE